MNNQQIDKIVNFYRINYQFHEPYQLLLDGNFIKLLLEKEIDLKRKFQNVTKGKATLRVTTCVLRELQLLGDSFKLVYQHAKKEKTIHCKHDQSFGVDRCFLELISEANQKMYLVCSQDLQLRRTLRSIGRVPILYFGPDQRITMEDIHKYSMFQLKKQQRLKFLPNQAEAKQVEQYKKKEKQQQLKKQIRTISSQQGINLKLKVAKGPNPLSVKGKKRVIQKMTDHQQNQQAPAKRKRIRKNKKATSNNQAIAN